MNKKKTLQFYDKAYLERTKHLSTEQIVRFLEGFRELNSAKPQKEPSTLISIRLPDSLLESLKSRAALENKPYQSLIKEYLKKAVS